jgi:hypothetical protein
MLIVVVNIKNSVASPFRLYRDPMNELKKRSTLFNEVIVKSWWTILFFLIVFFIYDRGMHYRDLEITKLTKKLQELDEEKMIAVKLQHQLNLQIESQTDSAWIEMVLMKSLGLVPEGEKKVLFLEKDAG